MNKFCCLFDACTVLNLIHLDNDTYLLNRIKQLDLFLVEEVYSEVEEKIRLYKGQGKNFEGLRKSDIQSIKNEIDSKMSFFRSKKFTNEKLLKECGNDYFNLIKTSSSYLKKENGELHSVGLAIYLSRDEPSIVMFYTDDYPAKEHFYDFFEFQQIGQIKDSVDLLLFLYWSNDSFKKGKLDDYLSNLYSLYMKEISSLKKSLNDLYNRNKNAASVKRNRDVLNKVGELINRLDKLEFKELNNLKDFFERKHGLSKDVNLIINEHLLPFDLDSGSKNNLINKIVRTRKKIDSDKIMCLLDLCET